MSTNLREYLKPFVREFEIRGMEHTFEHGGKHAKLMFVIKGKKFSLSIPTTPSDHRSQKNDLARLKQWLKPVPLMKTDTKTEEKVEPKPCVAHVRFGIHSDGRLSATIPTDDLEGISVYRAIITRSSEGRVIIVFAPTGGVKGSTNKFGTTSFVWTRSKVPFTYGLRRAHGKSTRQQLGKFLSPNSLYMDEQLPESILQLNKPKEPVLPFGKTKLPNKELPTAKKLAKLSSEEGSPLSIVEHFSDDFSFFNDA